MKDLLINSIMNNIKKYNNYDESKLKIIRFGLASLYLQITKLFVIFTISYFLGTIETLLKLMAFYTLLRLVAFGVHAKRSIDCWIASLSTFLLLPYLCEIISIGLNIKIIACSICILLISIYAPADTEKRPLIHKKKRIIYKVISIIISILYLIIILKIDNSIISNCIMFGLCLSTFTILPITYKLFGVRYNNYKYYKKEGKEIE